MPGMFTTGFKENGLDIGVNLVEKSYLMDMYPGLINQQKAPGLWLWGKNLVGELGDNTVVNKSSPVQTVAGGTNWKQVAAGGGQMAAIKTDGTLWTWGKNSYGQLGDNTIANKSSPVQTVAGGTNWKQVAAGADLTGAIKTDGTLWMWGKNLVGELGDNTRTSKSSPTQTVAGGANWKQVSCGREFASSIKTDGTLWSFGSNANGQLGDNTTANKSSPVQTVAGGTNWKQVSCGDSHTAAIKTDGTLWLWGNSNNGCLGDNTLVQKSSPVQTVAGGTNWKQVSSGSARTSAIKTDGTLWLWGYNQIYGSLGDNTTVSKSSPVQTVAGGTNWKQVSCGLYCSIAIKTDGTLWMWGRAGYGELGDNTVVNKSSPVQTVSGGNTWKSTQTGPYSSTFAAIKEGEDW